MPPPEHPISSTSPTEQQHSATVMKLDDFNKRALTKTVSRFYKGLEIPSLGKIKEELEETIAFKGGIAFLKKVLRACGLRYEKIGGLKLLVEKHDIVFARTEFLREMQHLKQSLQEIVYLDET